VAAQLAAAAHDLRTPLAAIKGAGAMLATSWDRLTDRQRRELAAAIGPEVERAGLLLDQLVEAARAETGSLRLVRERVAVERLVERAIEGAVPGGDPEVHRSGSAVAFADPARLALAIAGVLDAAVWWGAGGPIDVALSEMEGEVRIEVSRPSTDLSAEEAAGLAAPGRGDGSRHERLGLAVARVLVRAHGGDLRAKVDGGLRFTMTLPAGGEGSEG